VCEDLLMTVVRAAPLPDSGFGPTSGAAITLSAITMLTDPAYCVALAAPATADGEALRPEPPCLPAGGLDHDNRIMAG
jgi:hypothetical protein